MTLALSTATIAVIVVVLGLDLFAVFFGLSFMRARKAQRAAEAAAPGLPDLAPAKAVRPLTRRDFFRRSLLVSLAAFSAEFGGATLAFLWPNLAGGFGSVINAGALADIRNQIQQDRAPAYNGQGRFYIVPYSGKPEPNANYAQLGVTVDGIMSLYQRCVHLGCRVPFCGSSQWFECPCHGSKYNQAGEYKFGPAPRGMYRFKTSIVGGDVVVDTSQVILGPPRGTDTTGQTLAGPFCVAPG